MKNITVTLKATGQVMAIPYPYIISLGFSRRGFNYIVSKKVFGNLKMQPILENAELIKSQIAAWKDDGSQVLMYSKIVYPVGQLFYVDIFSSLEQFAFHLPVGVELVKVNFQQMQYGETAILLFEGHAVQQGNQVTITINPTAHYDLTVQNNGRKYLGSLQLLATDTGWKQIEGVTGGDLYIV